MLYSAQMNESPFYLSNLIFFAQAYECGTYGADAYGETSCETTTTQSSGQLAYTGESFWLTIVIALVLIVTPTIYLIKSRKKK